MNILKSGPEVRATRHAHKDFPTGALTPTGQEYSKEVGERDFGDKKIDRMISSSSERVQDTIGYINEHAGEPLAEPSIDIKGYLGLDGMNQAFLAEFDERVAVYLQDTTYVQALARQVDVAGITDLSEKQNRIQEIVQDQVAQDFLDGKFAIVDKVAGAIYFKRLAQFLHFYERGRFDTHDHPPMVLAGTHQTVNEAVLRGLFGDKLPQVWRTPVGYAEWVSYQPLTVEEDGAEKHVLKIEFRDHIVYVPFADIYSLVS